MSFSKQRFLVLARFEMTTEVCRKLDEHELFFIADVVDLIEGLVRLEDKAFDLVALDAMELALQVELLFLVEEEKLHTDNNPIFKVPVNFSDLKVFVNSFLGRS